MKILLAPAETKTQGGDGKSFCKDSFIFPELYDKREYIYTQYEDYVNSLDIDELSKWFGLKNKDEVARYKESLKDKPTKKAILRYDGVAFDYLDYNNLDISSQNYVDDNVLLFSNIFGVISAKDEIPDYKYKQGAKLPNVVVEKYYKENFSTKLDEYLKDEDIIDLRAGFYDKFYIPSKEYITMKFIKDGKVVSHWAKAYRGIVLKEMAKHDIQSIAELMNMQIEGLNIKEIKRQKLKSEIVYDII